MKTTASRVLTSRPAGGGVDTVLGIPGDGIMVGACPAMSGPGGSNLVDGLCDAAVDHAPVLASTGMQETSVLGTSYQQEVRLAAADLERRFRCHTPGGIGERGTVLLWLDTFNTDPSPGIARKVLCRTVRVLALGQHAGTPIIGTGRQPECLAGVVNAALRGIPAGDRPERMVSIRPEVRQR
jgi:hypothetical protein